MQIESCALILEKYCTFFFTLHFCQMLRFADWSQCATNWYLAIRCCDLQIGYNALQISTWPSDVAICRLATTRYKSVPSCQMMQYKDWSQHTTNGYPAVRCCNLQIGHNVLQIGTRLSDVAIHRLVTTRSNWYPAVRCCNPYTGHNMQQMGTQLPMLQFADWSQHGTNLYPIIRCRNLQISHNMLQIDTQLPDVAIHKLVTTPHTLVPYHLFPLLQFRSTLSTFTLYQFSF
jgi:hypothetical protein